MLRSGKDHLDSIRDGRAVYIGKERVADVTTHPAFRNGARTMAAIYDAKAAPANTELWYEEGGERFSTHFLQARTREALLKRTMAHRRIADMTLGLFGRSPDHVASFVTAFSYMPEVFDAVQKGFGQNVVDYYQYLRKNDLYCCYAVLPPQSVRNPEYYAERKLHAPTLRVVREDDGGLVISGMKMLATGAVFANEIWFGNIHPLAPDQKAESITCAVPINAPGLSLWSRKPFERGAASQFESPLAWSFDETDSMVLCKEVKVPWERVFVHNAPEISRNIYITTPAHSYSNHQSTVRFWSKLGFIVGLASRVAKATGAEKIPAVQEQLGRLAAQEALIGGLVMAQIQNCEPWPGGFVGYNRRNLYAALNWCIESYSPIVDYLRELCGGGVFQMPADASVIEDRELKQEFETYWHTPQYSPLERMKLFKLAWEFIGSEFAGRHQTYEKFYLGAAFTVRAHNFREAPWTSFHGRVDDFMKSYDVPGTAG
ncbi:MAG TPA: 4-hydroxyphenylacetate 3-hydroxylase N-terminal domain-containing protein [Burkholderiales bacterium]|nr:4-hydroxyphenylacetate 3-hydroxylase N-terminal domain-containing protein [Burkholderiales bacterium]